LKLGYPYPTKDDMKELKTKGGIEKWAEERRQMAGNLHKMEFYRIVLDEALVFNPYLTYR
jgi:hypothetical protein